MPIASTQRRLTPALLPILALAAALVPELAFAQSYTQYTGFLREFARWIFIDAGPYIFMIILAISVVCVAKGWLQMKTAVIAVIAAVFFFGIPAVVRTMAQQAASNI